MHSLSRAVFTVSSTGFPQPIHRVVHRSLHVLELILMDETNTAVIARLDRANPPSIPEAFEINREAAAYWIVRSSRTTTVLIVLHPNIPR